MLIPFNLPRSNACSAFLKQKHFYAHLIWLEVMLIMHFPNKNIFMLIPFNLPRSHACNAFLKKNIFMESSCFSRLKN
jgi:hypothetical protein